MRRSCAQHARIQNCYEGVSLNGNELFVFFTPPTKAAKGSANATELSGE